MSKILWQPSEDRRKRANITKFIEFVNKRHGLQLGSYDELYNWSVREIPDFWAAVWDFVGIKASRSYDHVVDDLRRFPGARWFSGARLNFAENLLRYRDDRFAFIFKGETSRSSRMTYAQLYDTVARLAAEMRQAGVVPGDRVAAYMPNLPETMIAMLATAAVGATWASCATDLGPQAVLARFGQIGPKVLFTVDGYFYKGKGFSSLPNVAQVAAGIPSLEKVVVVGYVDERPDLGRVPKAVHWRDFLIKEAQPGIQFEQLPFEHPLYIMFSSGTTGKPKCIVQSAGGVLINHLKELVLHTDLTRQDTIAYITTCSWMMWNWLARTLAVVAAILLFDGNPCYPDHGAM
ncbi:MAG: AMP-binding protein, partial [Chloroflexi bacterium]|nr:AMP-binding protein [Chloroflexota bacterium]